MRRSIAWTTILITCVSLVGSCKSRKPESSLQNLDVPAGSVLQEFIAINGNQLPHPLEKLKNALEEQGDPVIGMVVSSRSLQRDVVTVENPRIVGGIGAFSIARDPPKVDMDRKFYFGYSTAKDELEILAWNELLMQFEPFLVSNYKTSPHIAKADRKTCLACHQNDLAPIFPSRPWRETSLEETPKLNPDGPVKKALDMIELKNLNIDISHRESDGFRLDTLIRGSNFMQQAKRIGAKVCAESVDKACKRAVVHDILYGLFNVVIEEDLDSSKVDAGLKAAWPKNGFAYPSSVILDRLPTLKTFPTTTENGVYLTNTPKDEIQKKKTAGSRYHSVLLEHTTANGNFSFSEKFAKFGGELATNITQEQLKILLEPKTPRPLVSGVAAEDAEVFIQGNLHDMFSLTTDDSNFARLSFNLYFDSKNAERIALADSTFAKVVDKMVAAWPLNRPKIMHILLEGTVDAETLSRMYPESAAAISSAEPIQRPNAIAEPQGLAKYCGTCHLGEPPAPKIPFNDLVALRAAIAADPNLGKNLRDSVFTRRMPYDKTLSAGEIDGLLVEIDSLRNLH